MALSTRLKLFVGLIGDESEASSRHKRRRGSRPRELVRDALDAALPTLEERLRLRDLFLPNGEELPRRGDCRRPLPEVLPALEATEANELLEPDDDRARRGERER